MAAIKIYSTPSCQYCYALKGWLKEKNTPFQDFNVAEDDRARDEMVKKSGKLVVPVIDIDGEIIVGFDKERIAKRIGIK